MQHDVESETIKQEILKGNAWVLDMNYCREFDKFISVSYPWVQITGYRIDWSKVNSLYKRFKWDDASGEDTLKFLNGTCLNSFKECAIVYGAEEPGLLIRINEYTVTNLWRFLPPGFGTRFLVGVKRNDLEQVVLVPQCFIEIDMDTTDWLTAPC